MKSSPPVLSVVTSLLLLSSSVKAASASALALVPSSEGHEHGHVTGADDDVRSAREEGESDAPQRTSVAAFLSARGVSSSSHSSRQREQRERRLGPFGTIAGYEPTTKVTDVALLDLDHRSLSSQLLRSLTTTFTTTTVDPQTAFSHAESIYVNGGHSLPYAALELDRPLGTVLEEGTPILGLKARGGKRSDDAGGRIRGRHYVGGERTLYVSYPVELDPADAASGGGGGCRVGALGEVGEEDTFGCYEPTGEITVDGMQYTYTYDVLHDTYSHLSLANIAALDVDDDERQHDDINESDEFTELAQFREYYKDDKFVHRFVMAALRGQKVEYPGRGDADFSIVTYEGRAEAVVRGTAHLLTYVQILRYMNRAVAECRRPCSDECEGRIGHSRGEAEGETDAGFVAEEGCVLCDDEPSRYWDDAAALYVGSLGGGHASSGGEGEGEGRFLHALADVTCSAFGACNDSFHSSRLNTRIMGHFDMGQLLIGERSCDEAAIQSRRISRLMTATLVQGVLMHAHTLDGRRNRNMATRSGGEADGNIGEEARVASAAVAGATYAAAILPKVHACNPDDAEVLYGSMRVGSLFTDFGVVKDILESNYKCLGVKCSDVGGLVDGAAAAASGGGGEGSGERGEGIVYLEGAGPCVDCEDDGRPTTVHANPGSPNGPSATRAADDSNSDVDKEERRMSIGSFFVVIIGAFFIVASSCVVLFHVYDRVSGWKEHGEVEEGEMVWNEEGKPLSAGGCCPYQIPSDDEGEGEIL